MRLTAFFAGAAFFSMLAATSISSVTVPECSCFTGSRWRRSSASEPRLSCSLSLTRFTSRASSPLPSM
jgi:hypothetical protein